MTAAPSSPPPTPSSPPRACQRPDEPWVAAHTLLGSQSQLIFKRSRESKKCRRDVDFIFLLFYQIWGEECPVCGFTSGHFAVGISLLYHHFLFPPFNELRAFEIWDEITSAHVALWLPRWKMIPLSCGRCIFYRDRFIASVQKCAGIKIAPASLTDGPRNLFQLSAKSAWRDAPWVCRQTWCSRITMETKSTRRRTQNTQVNWQ